MSDQPVVATRGSFRSLRGLVLGVIVGILVLGGSLAWGLWRVERAAREVHVEVTRGEEERCRVTLLSRQGSLDKDIRIFTRLGRELGAPQERIDEFIVGIREDYAHLPVPADCR